jgi:hypothetical protein
MQLKFKPPRHFPCDLCTFSLWHVLAFVVLFITFYNNIILIFQRELQSGINNTVEMVQAVIANPKTDTKLGKVGF